MKERIKDELNTVPSNIYTINCNTMRNGDKIN